MAAVNNPAGRLYNILSRYEESRQSNTGQSPEYIWGQVLGNAGAALELGRVASLLAAIDDAVSMQRDPSLRRLVDFHKRDWAAPLFFPPVAAGHGMTGSQGAIPEASLIALESLSSMLSAIAPEGRDLQEEDRSDLHAELQTLLSAVRDDADLDPALKSLMLRRLHDIAIALDHYQTLGPGGLAAACERLLAEIVLHAPKDGETKSRMAPIMRFAGRVYTLVAFVGAAGDAAMAIDSAAKVLGIEAS